MEATKASHTAFNEFANDIEKHIKKFEYNPDLPFFRGCSNSDYKLTPSLFRNTSKIKGGISINYLENNLFYDFCAYGDGIIHNKGEWDILFNMQHHGIPTRLLDWTQSFGVALYFAIAAGGKLKNPCIWVLSPYDLNDAEKDKLKFSNLDYNTLYNPSRDFKVNYYDQFIICDAKKCTFDFPKALYPIKSNERIRSQWGVFTVHGNHHECISEQVTNSVKQFVIPDIAIPAAKLFLKRAGINQFSLFPDLQGLKSYLDREYYL